MSPDIKSIIIQEGSKIVSSLIKAPRRHIESQPQAENPEQAFERIYGSKKTDPGVPSGVSPETSQAPLSVIEKQEVETACVPCSIGHFSASAGLLNEAMRFKKDGITSREVLDRIAKVLEEQNALERVDLTPEKLQNTPAWERALAEEALLESRRLRHNLENIQGIGELEKLAANTETFYKDLNATWFKQKLGSKGITETKLKEMKQTAAQRAAEEVEKEVVLSEQ